MNTVQRYAGKGNNAPLITPTVIFDPKKINSSDEPLVNPRIYEAQSRLFDLEDRFAQKGNYAPVQLVDDLLLHFLITSAEDLTKENDADQLHVMLMLLDSLDEAADLNHLPSYSHKGFRSEPSRLYRKYSKRLSPDFLNLFELTDEEEARAGIMSVPDARSEPQLLQGSQVLVVSLEAHHYALAKGLVILVTTSAPDQPFSGRIIENDGQSLLLLPDNPTHCELRVEFATIRFLASIRYVINQPLV